MCDPRVYAVFWTPSSAGPIVRPNEPGFVYRGGCEAAGSMRQRELVEEREREIYLRSHKIPMPFKAYSLINSLLGSLGLSPNPAVSIPEAVAELLPSPVVKRADSRTSLNRPFMAQ